MVTSLKKSTIAARQIRFALATNGNHKQRGGYYTPSAIANFLAEWAVTSTVRTVLEPSAGDGVIVDAVSRRSSRAEITALELYADQAEMVRSRGLSNTNVITGDFFDWFRVRKIDGAFDAAVGNPPFIRFHDFEEDHRTPAFALMAEEGLHPSRLTNAWVPFIVAATKALRRGGRLAFVVPAELLQVSYAAELREYLARKFSQLTLVTFRRLVFDGIQQETVLLLGVRGDGGPARMRFVEADDLADLSLSRIRRAKPVSASLRHVRDKWTRYYLTSGELGLIEALEQCDSISRLGDLAEVDVGIVTGRNEFFVLSKDEAKTLGLHQFCLPLVGRSAHVPGVVLRPDDWSQLSEEGASCLLLQLGNVDRKALSEKAVQYVEYGEASGFHERYKCRIRQPRWWSVPSPWVPDAFLLRQIHDGPRIISNNAAATCTDTIHRVRMRNGHSPAWLAAASVNSLTWSFAEILGRSYGGGVLELEPTEAELLPIPATSELDIDHVDGLARNESMDDVLGYVDERTLIPMGLSRKDIQSLRSIWRKLFDRRRARKGRSRVGLETLVALPISALDLLGK
jgi:adenine-specific DNA methylase